ncbi:Testis-expressed sequence 10 protein [Phytophthora pseudosyringae]|uniref:Testis-expressed sequence 10 protein n=1 Tax=Phytophthora pseudosyringae TaxID=221518 RepID=A0A8T1V5G6_9STRA|nr:Testis-expressed sequence 10 protein [Phytophthora pseudosyringae]
MARAATATKSKKKPADFKRPKRKVGRRAAPAANVTSVGITSRRVNLLEQSLLQDKAGAAQLTHRRQTLPELLQQAGHYNAHVRQRALQGVRELAAQATAAHLRANASVLLERFLPTLLDEEAVVREAAVAAWKAVLPVLRAALAPFATLVATYLSSGLTHLQVGVRQDALRAIGELVDAAPELLREDAGREALARLLENFRDLVCAAQTQGIRMVNTYDLLLGATDSSSAGKKGRPSGRKGQRSKSKKPKAPSGALAMRFAALKVLHKLLLSVSAGPTRGKKSGARTARSASVPTTKTLLLYPAPHLVATSMFAPASVTTSSGEKASASWQEKVRALLPALLELWLECLEGSTDALSDGHVEHMKYIVECTSAVVGANTDRLNVDAEDAKDNEFFQAALKLREELLAPESFPMLPSASATLAGAADSLGVLSRWHGMNAALAKLACEYLHLPALMRCSGKAVPQSEALEQRVCSYVVTTLAMYKETPELRAVASMQNVLQPLLEVVALILASAAQRNEDPGQTAAERTLLLDAVTQFYVLCTPKSVSFRSCTAFAVEQLEIALRGQQRQSYKLVWPMVMQWVVCLADLLGQLDPQHMELSRRSLLALISVLKQLPVEFTSGDQMDGVLTNLSAFFDLAAVPSPSLDEDEQQRMLARTRFDALGAADQLAFVALVYHLPRYPVSLLRALASCCKSPRIYSEAKSFLVDILFQRLEAVDLAHIVSFLVSTALAPVEANAHQQRQQLQLVDHVCRTFVAMNLGNSLPKILAPTLAKAQAREEMNSMELHTLVLLYRTCVASATTRCVEAQQQRSDIPAEMERELVTLCVKVMAAYTASSSSEQSTTPEEIDAREQDRLLVEACVSTLARGETNIFAPFLDELLETQQQVLDLTRRLRVLQALVRTSSLAGAVRRHQSHVERLVQAVEQQHANEDDVAELIRQVRGDLELLAVGQLTEDGLRNE